MADPRPITAVDPVQATSLAGTAAQGAPAGTDLSMISLFLQADWVVKGVIILLVLAAFWCWAIIGEKWLVMRSIKSRARNFEHDFWHSEALDKFHEKTKKRGGHPMAAVFNAAMEEWQRSKSSISSLQMGGFKPGVRDRIMQVMMVTRNREMDRLENGLGFLATTGTSAPFIGLFGTVWGIMNSFHAIALTKNTSLAAVAPGIAEALFATAIGLLAAIPAVIFYNKFSNELTQFSGQVDDFCSEFNTILSRQVEG